MAKELEQRLADTEEEVGRREQEIEKREEELERSTRAVSPLNDHEQRRELFASK